MSDKPKYKVYEADLESFKPDPKNHNKHTLKGHKLVANSMQNRGYARPAFAANDGTVLGGNLSTMEIAPSLGIGEGRVIVVETDGTVPIIHKRVDVEPDSIEAKQLSYEDNFTGILSFDLDAEIVMADMESGFDFEAIGVSLDELGEMLEGSVQELLNGGDGQEPKDIEPKIKGNTEELRQKYGIELDQVWALGNHKLAIGDCEDEALKSKMFGDNRPRYGMHDPPYGINVVGLSGTVGSAKSFGKIGFTGVVPVNYYAPVLGDDKPFDPGHILKFCSDNILWGANYYADKLPPQKGWLVWDKKGREDWRDTFSDCELAWTSFKVTTRVYHHVWMGMVQEGEKEQRVHPTQKPVALFEKIMRQLFLEDGIVTDFYLGSGPTLLACERLGKTCYGFELSLDYGAIIIDRWHTLTSRDPIRVSG